MVSLSDGLADKAYEVRMKHYGDHAAEQKVLDKRAENAHLVKSVCSSAKSPLQSLPQQFLATQAPCVAGLVATLKRQTPHGRVNARRRSSFARCW